MAIPASITPILFTGLVGWAYYRRIASSFGRQPWRPVRAGIRLGLMAVALFFLGVAAVYLRGAALAVGIGVACGSVLAGFALRYVHAEVVDGQRGYTPHPWIGGMLSLLLIGRLLWRMGSGGMAAFAAGSAANSPQSSPLTMGIAAVLVSYYLVNNIGLFVIMHRLAPQVAAAPANP